MLPGTSFSGRPSPNPDRRPHGPQFGIFARCNVCHRGRDEEVRQHASVGLLGGRDSCDQGQVDFEAGLRQALISAIEVGTANPTLESLDRLASALGTELAVLFDRTAR